MLPNYLECGALCRPCSFISKDEAVNLILRMERIKKYEKLTASLKYSYSNVSQSHYYPFWEINIDEKLYYLDQQGKLHRKLIIY
jgi:hypothetical protein